VLGPSLRHRYRVCCGLLGALGVVSVGSPAWGYWTQTGTGSAHALTGTLNAPVTVSTPATTGAGSVHVTWTAATLSTGQTAQSYYVTRVRTSDSATFPACSTSAAAPVGTLSCDDLSVPDGAYRYRVTALYETWSATSALSSTVIVDTIAPTVTINQAPGQADPTNASPVNYTVVFSEAVTGFTTSDITFTGTAGATTATITGTGPTYTVAISGMTGNGTVRPTIAAASAQDATGNTNTASTSTDNTITYDTVAPTAPTTLAYVDGNSGPGDKITGNAEKNATVTITQTQGPHTGPTYTDIVNNQGAFTVPVDNVGIGTILLYSVTAKDAAGNTSPASLLGPVTDTK
jgi:hypothetical protein